jgi:hypothetical protein
MLGGGTRDAEGSPQQQQQQAFLMFCPTCCIHSHAFCDRVAFQAGYDKIQLAQRPGRPGSSRSLNPSVHSEVSVKDRPVCTVK